MAILIIVPDLEFTRHSLDASHLLVIFDATELVEYL